MHLQFEMMERINFQKLGVLYAFLKQMMVVFPVLHYFLTIENILPQYCESKVIFFIMVELKVFNYY